MSRPVINQADIEIIRKLRDCEDNKSEMLLQLAEGKQNLETIILHVRCAQARDQRNRGLTHVKRSNNEKAANNKMVSPDFLDLDALSEDGRTLHDSIADEQDDIYGDPAELLDSRRSRTVIFRDDIENMLLVAADGSAAMCRVANTSQRMMQISMKTILKKLEIQGSLMSIEDRLEFVLTILLLRREGVTSGRKKKSATGKRETGQGDLFGDVQS